MKQSKNMICFQKYEKNAKKQEWVCLFYSILARHGTTENFLANENCIKHDITWYNCK